MLSTKFDGFNLNFTKKSDSKFSSLLVNHWYLTMVPFAFFKPNKERSNELPANFVIFATTSQIVDSISEVLRIIKNQSSGYIPSNITTIQDFETEKEKDFMSYGSSTKTYICCYWKTYNMKEILVRTLSGVLYISIIIFAMFTSREWFMDFFRTCSYHFKRIFKTHSSHQLSCLLSACSLFLLLSYNVLRKMPFIFF